MCLNMCKATCKQGSGGLVPLPMLSAFLSSCVQYHDTGRLCVCVRLVFSYCAVRYCTSCPGLCGYADHVSISPKLRWSLSVAVNWPMMTHVIWLVTTVTTVTGSIDLVRSQEESGAFLNIKYLCGGSWGSGSSEASATWIVQRIWSTLLDFQSFGFGMGLEISLFFEPRSGVRDWWWTSSHSPLSGETRIVCLSEALHVFSHSVQSAGVSGAEAENLGAACRNACGTEATWLGSRYHDCRIRSSESLSFSAKPPRCRGRTCSSMLLSCCH